MRRDDYAQNRPKPHRRGELCLDALSSVGSCPPGALFEGPGHVALMMRAVGRVFLSKKAEAHGPTGKTTTSLTTGVSMQVS